MLGGILTGYILTGLYWAEIWSRLGPAEQYATFGTAIFALGAWRFVRQNSANERLDSSSLLMALGAAIAMGSKENMLFLAAPLAVALGYALYRRRIGAVGAISLLMSLILAIWVVMAILLALSSIGWRDIYNRELEWAVLLSATMIRLYAILLLLALSLLAFDKILIWHGSIAIRQSYRNLVRRYVVWIIILALIIISQVVFYSGVWPMNGRYDFPGRLVEPALYILLFLFFSELGGIFWSKKLARLWMGSLVGTLLLIVILVTDFKLDNRVYRNVQRTNEFTAALQEIERIAKTQQGAPIIVVNYDSAYIEHARSIAIFLRHLNVPNPLFLRIQSSPKTARLSATMELLDRRIRNLSQQGDYYYRPFSQLKDYEKKSCLSIGLRGPPQKDCKGVRIDF